jgi:hypothetical protein
MVQGFISEGDLQFSKLFKNTICKGVCTVKCTEKRFIPFLPSFFFFLNVSPIKNLKEALNISTGMYCNIHLLEIMRRTALYPIHPLSLGPFKADLIGNGQQLDTR